ncbi:MAG: hypothetical protein JW745_08575, partial [Sedimentisphaerales bacterium]|nr:hypothetical protein [Sedimentisphaerales bacterium]
DRDFFIKLADALEIKGYFIWAVDGVGNLNTKIPDFTKLPGFNKISHFVVIRDRDSGSIESAFDSVKNILVKANFVDVPEVHGKWSDGQPKIGIFINPGEKNSGTMLEDLCLSTVSNSEVMDCVNAFAACISAKENCSKNMAKTKCIAYLGAQQEPKSTINGGAQCCYWNFDAPELNELKDFLSELKDH